MVLFKPLHPGMMSTTKDGGVRREMLGDDSRHKTYIRLFHLTLALAHIRNQQQLLRVIHTCWVSSHGQQQHTVMGSRGSELILALFYSQHLQIFPLKENKSIISSLNTIVSNTHVHLLVNFNAWCFLPLFCCSIGSQLCVYATSDGFKMFLLALIHHAESQLICQIKDGVKYKISLQVLH